MREQNALILIEEFQKKLDALRNKIAIQQSLMTSITAEFESLYSVFDSLNSKIVSTNTGFVSSDFNFVSTEDNFVSSNLNNVSTDNNFVSSKDKIVSTEDKSVSSNLNNVSTNSELTKKIIHSASAVKIYFGQPDIPERIAKILSTIPEKGKLSIVEMEKLTGASHRSIVRDIRILKQMGWLKFNGSRKNGYFTLTEVGKRAVEG